MPGRAWGRAIGAYAGATTLCLVILFWVMGLWRRDLAIPFYEFRADVIFYSSLIKGLLDNGWYLHNRFIGMPAGLNFHEFPMADNLYYLLMKTMSFWTSDYAVILNLYFLLTFPLTVLTSLCVFRRFRVSYPPAIVGSLLFAFLPYHFWRGERHPYLASYYLVPLVVMVILWVCLGESLFRYRKDTSGHEWSWASPKGIASVVICVLVASGGVYYAFFAGFLLLVAGVFACFRYRSLRQLLASGILSAVIVLASVINISPSIIYVYQHGGSTELMRRSPAEAEIYGLKIAQLLLPVSGHRVNFLKSLKWRYHRGAPMANENDSSSLGVFGALGFLCLIGWLVFGKSELQYAELFNSLSVLNVFAVLLGTTGGFGAIIAFAALPQIRAYNRISVYIGFFSLFALVLLLQSLAQRWAGSRAKRCVFNGALGLVLLIGILDQAAPGLIVPYEGLRPEYVSDADFIRLIEASVPEHSMIFQLPYVPFPESRPVHRMQDYDLFRGYLHSKTLRWSYGATKFSAGDAWQREVAAKPLDEMVEILAFAGFRGIYLDRYGYADMGADIEAKLSRLLDIKSITSANQRLAFFNMAKLIGRLQENYPAEEWQERRDVVLHPLLLQWKGGFSSLEGTPRSNWRWCSSKGELSILNLRERKVLIEMVLATGHQEFSNLKIDGPWFSETLNVNAAAKFFSKAVLIPPGRHVIRFVSDARRVNAPRDPRVLVFKVGNFRLTELSK